MDNQINKGVFISDEFIGEFGPEYIEVADNCIRLGTDRFKIIERDMLRRGYWVERWEAKGE